MSGEKLETLSLELYEAQGRIRMGVEGAIDAGRILTEAKALLPHGRWEPWLGERGIAPRTARRYMALHARGLTAQEVTDEGGVSAAARKTATMADLDSMLEDVHDYTDAFRHELDSWGKHDEEGRAIKQEHNEIEAALDEVQAALVIEGFDEHQRPRAEAIYHRIVGYYDRIIGWAESSPFRNSVSGHEERIEQMRVQQAALVADRERLIGAAADAG